MDELFEYELSMTAGSKLSLSGSVVGRFVRFTLSNPAVNLSADEIHNLFMPHRGGIPLLVVKQIVREHDTFMGHLGCRAQAEAMPEGGHAIWFTLPLATKPNETN
jgi:hypothetical protein